MELSLISLLLTLSLLPLAFTESTHQPCPLLSDEVTFSISNWRNDTSNGVKSVSFDLTADYDGSSTFCRGDFAEDSREPRWIQCEEHDDDFITAFSMQGSVFGDYLYLNYRFACARPTPYKPIVHGTADTTLSVDTIRAATGYNNGVLRFSATEIAVPVSEPRMKCSEVLQHEPEWFLRRLNYSILHAASSGPMASLQFTTAILGFDLFNTANDFVIHCRAISLNGYLADDQNIIDPNLVRYCPDLVGYGEPGGPTTGLPANYPNTTFQFNRVERWLSIHQEWQCEEDDGSW